MIEFLFQYGEIEEMNVCDNLGDHLVGNVYVKVSFFFVFFFPLSIFRLSKVILTQYLWHYDVCVLSGCVQSPGSPEKVLEIDQVPEKVLESPGNRSKSPGKSWKSIDLINYCKIWYLNEKNMSALAYVYYSQLQSLIWSSWETWPLKDPLHKYISHLSISR